MVNYVEWHGRLRLQENQWLYCMTKLSHFIKGGELDFGSHRESNFHMEVGDG